LPMQPERDMKPGQGEVRLVAYKPLFSGAAVERVPELQFQRPEAEVELSVADARRLKIEAGSPVNVSSNGTSVELRARVNPKLLGGVARIAAEHAGELGTSVEVKR